MTIEFATVFYEFAALLAAATLIGLVGTLLRQPLIVSFIGAGLVAGTGALGISRSTRTIELLSQLGVALLLFLVGLKLDLKLVRSVGRVAVATGLGQILFTTVLGFGLCLLLGLDLVASAYVSIALTFSSTIIIVKLLSDKRELDSLHGRIAIGFLIVQDLAVVAAMVGLAGLEMGAGADRAALGLLRLAAGGVFLLGLVAIFMRYVAERLVRRMAAATELLVTFGISWAVVLAACGDWLGLGKELGGLIAGVSLASTSYRDALAARLSGLRDFLLLFFFVSLGLHLDLGALGTQIPAAIALSAFVLIGNPLIVVAIMGWMGYRKRTGFLAGLTVSQISEFSLVFVAMGVRLGHLSPATMGLVTLVGLVTITISTYMISYSQTLYRWFDGALTPFERAAPHKEDQPPDGPAQRYDAIVFGLGRYGGRIVAGLAQRGLSILGVDFDPAVVEEYRRRGQPVMYGDALDPEFPPSLPLEGTQWIVIGFPARGGGVTHSDPRLVLTSAVRALGFTGHVAAVSESDEESSRLRQAGVDRVLVPFQDAAEEAVDLILSGQS